MISSSAPLPCGRRLDELVEARADGQRPSGHPVAGCTHCRRAVERIERLERSVLTLREERVVAPAGFVDEVMRRIEVLNSTSASVAGARLRTRGDEHLDLPTKDLGTTSVRSRVVAALVAASAHRFDAAQVVRVEARIEARDTTIVAETIVAYPGPVPDVAARLRDHLRDELQQILGVDPVVDVRIVGLLTRRRRGTGRREVNRSTP